METINRITLKALLIDTITFLKYGHHLAPNWKGAKNRLCIASGQNTNISNKQFLHLIGLTYQDNKIENEFWQMIDKYNANEFLK